MTVGVTQLRNYIDNNDRRGHTVEKLGVAYDIIMTVGVTQLRNDKSHVTLK